jgi:hypothetical protein
VQQWHPRWASCSTGYTGVVRGMVERLSVRYAAIACVVAGGLMMGGGGVAFAKPDDPKGPRGDGPSAPAESDTPASGHGGDHGQVYKKPTSALLSAPKFNIPSRLGPLTLPNLPTLPQLGPVKMPAPGTPRWGSVTPAGANGSPQLSLPNLPFGILRGADGTQLNPGASPLPHDVATSPAKPPISFVPPIPGDHAGPTIVIKNPLPDTLPIDLDQPIGPQLLPSPLVSILEAASQQIPLTDLVISPFLNDVLVPRLLSDIIVPALLSDVVVPTISLSSFFPGSVEGVPALRNPAIQSLNATFALPSELAPTGIDLLPQAPLTMPAPVPSAPLTDPPQQPPSAPSAPKNDVALLSEPVAYRAGYSDYLRNAGMAQITSIALPGVAGILLVTIGGGFIGYRQARAGHIIRAQGIARFLR